MKNSEVIISKIRYLSTFNGRTYLDRKEKTGLWTYFFILRYQIKIAPGGIIVT